jgi:hypothetical protein
MGTWGTEVFANDDAMDWIAELENTDDISVLERALEGVNGANGHLEAPECSVALAAAEVVATILKKPGPDVPSEVFEWIARVGRDMPPSLEDDALRALDRISAESELLDLWEEAGEPELGAWHATIAELRGRLE